VLLCLVERAGHLVTKAEIHRRVWQQAAVVEDTPTQSIADLRRALGDVPDARALLEAVRIG
jgi:DNA-binding winged helix-turn-helix (wHTH) protein